MSDGDACDTFQLVAPPGDATWLHSVTACLKVCMNKIYTVSIQYLRNILTIYTQYFPTQGNLYHLGGTATLDGPRFGYIWCSFDLQEFHTRYTERWGHIQGLLSAE